MMLGKRTGRSRRRCRRRNNSSSDLVVVWRVGDGWGEGGAEVEGRPGW